MNPEQESPPPPPTKQFALVEDEQRYAVTAAESAKAALTTAIDNVDANTYITSKTVWIKVRVFEVDEDGEVVDGGDRASSTVVVDPEIPVCRDREGDKHDEHRWESPYELLGGVKENPGVVGHGGGVVITEVCTRCGVYRDTDTWAQNPETGEQGLRSVSYRDADEAAEKYLA